VTEASLTRAVRAVRRALGESAERDGVIRTVRGRGYGIGIDVERFDAAPSPRKVGSLPSDAPEEDIAHTPDFVGRESVLARLESALGDALAGRGVVVFVTGEAGIGKTRTAEELARRAMRRGAEVLWGRCTEGEGAPALWPWVQIVRAAIASRSPEALREQLGARAAEIAAVVPEIRERLPDLDPPPRLDAEQERFRFADGLARFIVRASAVQPIVLVLEDLHWADASSLRILRFLAPELAGSRILLLGTHRDTSESSARELDETLVELARLPHAYPSLELTGLSQVEVAQLVAIAAGGRPDLELAAAIHARTEGNPFFVRELVRLAAAEGAPLEESAWRGVIPASVRAVVRQRVSALSGAARELLSVAAVIGRDAPLPLLAAALGQDEESLLLALEEVEASGLLAEHPEDPECFRFSNALVQETLYDALSRRERVRLHARVGEAIESLHARRIDPFLPFLAHHFRQAAFGEQFTKAIDYLDRAAVQAQQQLAFERAAELFGEAVRLLEARGAPDERRLAGLLLARARSLLDSGSPSEGQALAWRAIEIARGLEAWELVVRAAHALVGADYTSALGEDLLEVLAQAFEGLGDDRPSLRVTALASRCRAGYFTLAPEVLDRESREALEAAREIGEGALLRYALGSRANVLMGSLDFPARQGVVDEWLACARQDGDEMDEFRCRLHRLLRHQVCGNRAGLDEELESCERLSAALRRRPTTEGPLRDVRAMLALSEGRLDVAEQLMGEALELMLRADVDRAFGSYAAKLGLLRRMQGRLLEFEPLLRRQLGGIADWMAISLGAGLGHIHVFAGRLLEARIELQAALAREEQLLRRGVMHTIDLAMLSELASWLDDAPACELLYELLVPHRSTYACAFVGTHWGSAARCLGLLATTLGRWDEAESDFEEALATDRAMGFRLWEAQTLHDFARMRLRRGAAGDSEAARAQLDQVVALADEFGMKGLVESARELRGD
jgi:tetratricopeptide (TPR) repeat protein